MKTTVLKYNVIVRKQGKSFIADVPTLGISDFGETLDKTKKNIKAAILCHVEGLIKTKTEVPAPDTENYYISQTEVTLPTAISFSV
jgi:predicted RNase H-like HicB family nuclease